MTAARLMNAVHSTATQLIVPEQTSAGASAAPSPGKVIIAWLLLLPRRAEAALPNGIHRGRAASRHNLKAHLRAKKTKNKSFVEICKIAALFVVSFFFFFSKGKK